MITLRLLGQVHAAGRTITQLRDSLDESYKKYYKVPSITVTPTKEDQHAVGRSSQCGRSSLRLRRRAGHKCPHRARWHDLAHRNRLRSCPRAHAERAAAGNQRALSREDRRHGNHPRAQHPRPRYCYVLGEVTNPGRFEMIEPTTALQAISMAGSWNVGRDLCADRRLPAWR